MFRRILLHLMLAGVALGGVGCCCFNSPEPPPGCKKITGFFGKTLYYRDPDAPPPIPPPEDQFPTARIGTVWVHGAGVIERLDVPKPEAGAPGWRP